MSGFAAEVTLGIGFVRRLCFGDGGWVVFRIFGGSVGCQSCGGGSKRLGWGWLYGLLMEVVVLGMVVGG